MNKTSKAYIKENKELKKDLINLQKKYAALKANILDENKSEEFVDTMDWLLEAAFDNFRKTELLKSNYQRIVQDTLLLQEQLRRDLQAVIDEAKNNLVK